MYFFFNGSGSERLIFWRLGIPQLMHFFYRGVCPEEKRKLDKLLEKGEEDGSTNWNPTGKK